MNKWHIVRNEFGAFCTSCGSHLGIEEDDWDECDACGGDGIGDEDEWSPFDEADDKP